VRLMSRNRKDNSDRYPEVVEAFEAMERDGFIVDGEMVAFEGNVTSFSRLQGRMKIQDADEARQSGIAVHFYVFDILHLDGYDVTGLPLRRRKGVLREALEFDDPIRFTPHRNGDGVAYWKEACRKGWEGVIAKDAVRPYTHGRSKSWLKFKCVHQQELVVGGFTDPKGDRVGFGALLLGFYQDGELRYAGKVGTGWDEETLDELRTRLDRLERETSPFADAEGIPGKGVHWVRPELVGEVGFTEWTEDDRLRHPRWIGERQDKDPEDVVKEEPGA
jgi:bifunctional non-homologous end joining protein LigD